MTSTLTEARPCPHCDELMTNPRRTQCGAPECVRLARNARMAGYMRARRAVDPEYGRRYDDRVCAGCSTQIRVRAEKPSRLCPTCTARAGALAANATRTRLPADELQRRRAERRRASKRAERNARRASGMGYATVPLPPELKATRQRERQYAKSARRRARKRGAVRAPFRRLDIFERDGWLCYLCARPLARAEVVPHPLAPTIDHVIPLARSGAHAPWNVRAAHFLCNSAKSDRVAEGVTRCQ